VKKIINQPGNVVREMLEGITLGNRDLTLLPGENVVMRADIDAHRRSGCVALISGGGSGHEPAHAGYVGEGLLTAAVAGDVFTSPSVDAVLAAIHCVTGSAGTLLIVKNYTGDRLNFGLAAEIARSEGRLVEMVMVDDDVALSDDASFAGSRGLAGTILVHKVAGAAAASGLTLAEVKRETESAIVALGTMGLALTPCTVPAAGIPSFTLAADEIELGLGIHGEPGIRRTTIAPADALVEELLERIVTVRRIAAGARVALLVNNLGASPPMELAIVTRAALTQLSARGIIVERVLTGTYLTALEMAGFSLSLMTVNDRRLAWLSASASAPAWAQMRVPQVGAAPGTQPVSPLMDTADTSEPESRLPAAEVARLRRVIELIIAELIAAEPTLTRMDSAVGDGDLGISLARGAAAVCAELDQYDLERPARLLRQVSATLRRVLGGTSGPLYSTFLLRMSVSLPKRAQLSCTDWAAAFAAGCEAVSTLGGAKVGERTMLDAMVPAAQAMSAGVLAGVHFTEVLTGAWLAAQAGAEATKTIMPRRGRSTYLGARALGHPDPGAYAVTLWLRALVEGLVAPGDH